MIELRFRKRVLKTDLRNELLFQFVKTGLSHQQMSIVNHSPKFSTTILPQKWVILAFFIYSRITLKILCKLIRKLYHKKRPTQPNKV